MAERTFGSATKKLKHHKFTLEGQTFRVYPGMSVTYLMRGDPTDEEQSKKPPLQRTIDFIRSMIVKEDRAAFDKMVVSPDVFIEADDLLDIAKWIVEVLSKRPTTSPASSGNGAGRTSTGSKAKSSGPGGKASKNSPSGSSSS